MSEPMAGARWQVAVAWTRMASWVTGATHNARRSALAVFAVLLLIVAAVAPMPHSDVIDSAQVSIAFFATLLTGEAVIFALSFSVSSAWQSLREIDRHIAFREWVVTGWLASIPAEEAMSALTTLTGCAGPAGGLWDHARAVASQSRWAAPMPAVEHYRRLAACVLVIASRLAPLAPRDADRELQRFLAGLPSAVLAATARLASRVLPHQGRPGDLQPAQAITEGLRVVQLVGAHRFGTR